MNSQNEVLEVGMHIKGFGVVTALNGNYVQIDNQQWLLTKQVYGCVVYNMTLKELEKVVKMRNIELLERAYQYTKDLNNPLTGLATRRFRRSSLSEKTKQKIFWLQQQLNNQLKYLKS